MLGPGLFEFNLASHLVWWVAGTLTIVTAGIAAAEALAWFRNRLIDRRLREDPNRWVRR